MNTLTFNGHTSNEFGIRIEKMPALNRPARKFQVASVPGRNGNIYELEDAWEEIIQPYEIFAGTGANGSAVSSFANIMEWLHSADGYAVLSDTYDTTHYRMAVFVDSTDIESTWHTWGRAVINFRCRPERYLVGSPITPISGYPITNPTNHIAKPIITLTGQYAANFTELDGRQIMMSITEEATPGYFSRIYDLADDWVINNCGVEPSDGYIPMTISSAITNSVGVGTINYNAGANHGVGIPISVQPNTEYSLSFKVTKTGSSDDVKATVYFFDRTSKFTGRYITKTKAYTAGVKVEFNFTTPIECGYIMLVVSGGTNATVYTLSEIMLNLGLTTEPYVNWVVASVSIQFNGTWLNIGKHFRSAVIDCENEDVYIEGQLYNSLITVTKDGYPSAEYLHLKSGSNAYYTSGGADSVSIEPRFWEL